MGDWRSDYILVELRAYYTPACWYIDERVCPAIIVMTATSGEERLIIQHIGCLLSIFGCH